MAAANPLRYRSYYFDEQTWFYYLQSRYYDPAIGRFINADVYVSTGQGVLGNNMFAYCNNSPVQKKDIGGTIPSDTLIPHYNQYDYSYGGGGGPVIVSGYLLEKLIDRLSAVSMTTRSQDKEDERVEVGTLSKTSDPPVLFPSDPNDFNPIGLIKVRRPGTKNGAFISWIDPLEKTEVFRWDENPNYPNGPHYHINNPIYQIAKVHFYPNTAVPEPYATIYFPFR